MLVFFCAVRIIDLNMDKKFYKNEKFQKTFYAVLYLVCAFAFVISGCYIFYKTYYSNVYVSGTSMSPTLIGGNVDGRNHYGISDNHRTAINNLKRFDVVITYYPSQWTGTDEDTVYKIKRVWGFPGETISMSFDNDKYTFTVSVDNHVVYETTAAVNVKDYAGVGQLKVASFTDGKRTFDVNAFSKHYDDNGQLVFDDAKRTSFTVSLNREKQEYFLMGDNWTASSDSYTHLNMSQRISYDNLQGKVVAIKGTAVVVNGELKDKKKIRNMYYF